MKALSIKEPWATLILHFGKDVENRTWRTGYTGPLVICASARPDGAIDEEDFPEYNEAAQLCVHGYTLGKALGLIELYSYTRSSMSKWAQEGQWHWLLRNPRPFTIPFRIKGQLGLFDVDDLLIEAAR